jgi:hypothetical protein
LFAQSNNFTSVGDWYIYKDSGSTFTQTSNYGTSPDGTQNATRLQANITAGVYANYARYFNVTIGTTYTYSIYIKSLSGTPTIRFVTPNGSAQSITLTTNWERYTYTFTASSADFYGNFYIESPTSLSYDLLAYGSQLEASSYPTSYIPTTSASATRVADACSKTGISSLIGQTEGTLFFDGYCNSNAEIISINRSTVNSVFLYSASGNVRAYVYSDSTGLNLPSSVSCLTRFKAAVAYKSNSIAFYVNGTLISQDTSTTFTPNVTMENFYIAQGGYVESKEQVNCNEAIIFPTRLTNAELASLTTI